ncbi:MAG: CAP domain-containing protein [Acidimicrobiales bacterium]
MLKLIIAIFVVVMPVAVAVSPATAAPAVPHDDSGTFFGLVNGLRASAGAAALTADPVLTSVAQAWASNMASSGVLSHNPNLSTQAPSGWTVIGENIGDGFSLQATYNALVGSPDHYANMVNKSFNRTGVGVATDSNGQVWVAQDFGDYPPPPPSTFTFPTTGNKLLQMAQSFTWQQAPGAVYYCMTVGSTQGGVDYVNSGLLQANQLSYSVPILPAGMTLWARIYTYSGGAWNWTDASFTVSGAPPGSFSQPTAGQTISPSSSFTWSAASGAQYYWLTVGTSMGGYNTFYTPLLPATQTSYALPTLPTNQVLWATIYTYESGAWTHAVNVPFIVS